MNRNVVIFKEELLPLSETFIKAQAETLQRYRALYAGLVRSTPSLDLNREAVVLAPTSQLKNKLRLLAHRYLRLDPAFLAELVKHNPALFHAHFARSGSLAVLLAQKLSRPLIVTFHGYDVTTLRDCVDVEKLSEGAAKFICVSDFIRKRAISAGYPEDKLVVHRIGVDCQKFSRSRQYEASRNVLFVGRLVEKKGVEYFLRAMHLVQKEIEGVTATIIGDGPLRSQLESLAFSLEVNVQFLGKRSNDEVRVSLERAALFCLPSITASDGDSEGLPISILEAQALKIPVVSTRHAGIPEIISSGKNGLLSDEKNVVDLASNIWRYLDDWELARTAGESGRLIVEDQFDLRKQTTLLEEIYDQTTTCP